MLTSTMFLNDVTSVDHAYVGVDGWVHGNSYNPMMEITGQIDSDENVVVDFSTIKKDIKSILDHKNAGLDHKLWFVPDFSKGKYEFVGNDIVIDTPHFLYKGHKSSVNVFHVEDKGTGGLDISFLNSATKRLLNPRLRELYPDINVRLKMKSDVGAIMSGMPYVSIFHYTHGLKSSTSWGCQNMMHGHRSFIHTDVDARQSNNPHLQFELNKIANQLNDKMFVWSDNWDNATKTIQYDSRDRGEFRLDLKTEFAINNLIIIPTETTVEWIVAYVKEVYGKSLKAAGAKYLFVSEGQNKGATEKL